MMRVWWWCWHDWWQCDRQSDESFTSRLAEMVDMHTSGGPSILLTKWRNLWDAGTRMHNPPWIGTYKCCAMNTIRSNSRSMYTACHLWMTLWIVRNANIVNLKLVRHKFVELGWEIIGMSSEFTQSLLVCFGRCVMYGWGRTGWLGIADRITWHWDIGGLSQHQVNWLNIMKLQVNCDGLEARLVGWNSSASLV